MKRAITLGGGGPAVGLHIGALKCFREYGIEFDVWALSCVGAWAGVAYNSFDKDTALEQTEAFFRSEFRPDAVYDKFPISPAFAPDIQSNIGALMKFMVDPKSYQNLVVPEAFLLASQKVTKFMSDPKYWNPGDFNHLMLELMSANPMARFMTSLMWRSELNGLSRTYYKDSSIATIFDIDRLYRNDAPFIYHNAWNLKEDRIQLFANRKEPPAKVLPLSMQSVSACSALPFVIEPVVIDDIPYCEGAVYRTVNFTDLLEFHPDLEEVWVIRIVADKQVLAPRNLDDSLNNLCMLFAGSLGECNVEAFEEKIRNDPKLKKQVKIRIVPVSHTINYDWSYSNLDRGIEQGYANTRETIERFRKEEA